MIHIVKQGAYGAGLYCKKIKTNSDIVLEANKGLVKLLMALYRTTKEQRHVVIHGYGLVLYLILIKLFFYKKFIWIYFCHSYEWEIKTGLSRIVHIFALKLVVKLCPIRFSIHEKLKYYCDDYCKMDNLLINENLSQKDILSLKSISKLVVKEKSRGKKLILLVGRNVVLKNFIFVAETFADIDKVEVFHFGDASPLGKVPSINHLGYLPNECMVAAMEMFDYVCIPSLVEAAPTVTLEALASGSQIMVSDIEAHSHIDSQFRFDPEDKISLIKCFNNLEYGQFDVSRKELFKQRVSKSEIYERMQNWIEKQA